MAFYLVLRNLNAGESNTSIWSALLLMEALLQGGLKLNNLFVDVFINALVVEIPERLNKDLSNKHLVENYFL